MKLIGIVAVSVLLLFGSILQGDMINGIDFWENDRLYLPDYGASTNLIQNPSFEAGFRYWAYLSYNHNTVPLEYSNFETIDSTQAHSGSHSLRLRALPFSNPMAVGVFPLPLIPDTNYTLSFYVKGCFANYLTLNVWGRGQAGSLFSTTHLTFSVNNQWQRFTIPFTANERFSTIFFDAKLSTASGEPEGCIWVDDIQLEPGSVATAFTQAPVAAQLVSAARGNFLPFGQEPDFNLMIQSLPDAEGTVSLSVEDFFFKTIF